MKTLIIADHNNTSLAGSFASLLTAAFALEQPIDILVAGHDCQSVAEEVQAFAQADKVLYASSPCYQHFLAESVAPLIVNIAGNYSVILACAGTTGKDLMPRVAGLMGVNQVSDIIEVISPDTFVRPIYAGNALATVQSSDAVKLLTIRTSAFEEAQTGSSKTSVETLDQVFEQEKSQYVSENVSVSERPDLTSASIVISGGRGLGSGDNFQLLEKIADKLGAAIGASRAAVDAGFVSNDYQVGQTGKIVAPDLYIAVGISGAIQHLAGMKDSKVIVAINKDEDAPIFDIADYGLVADLFEALPELDAML